MKSLRKHPDPGFLMAPARMARIFSGSAPWLHFPATPPENTYTDAIPPGSKHGFYRIVVE